MTAHFSCPTKCIVNQRLFSKHLTLLFVFRKSKSIKFDLPLTCKFSYESGFLWPYTRRNGNKLKTQKKERYHTKDVRPYKKTTTLTLTQKRRHWMWTWAYFNPFLLLNIRNVSFHLYFWARSSALYLYSIGI